MRAKWGVRLGISGNYLRGVVQFAAVAACVVIVADYRMALWDVSTGATGSPRRAVARRLCSAPELRRFMIRSSNPIDSPSGISPHAARLAAAKAGSLRALGELLEGYRAELLELANAEVGSTVGPKESASDVVQECLLDAATDFGQFQGTSEEELRGWLRRIVRNRSIDVGRRYRQAEMRDVSREEPLDARLRNELAVDDASPSEQVVQDEATRRMLAAVERLPEPQRSIVRLRHVEGRTFAEIGTRLECSPFRARRAWYEALQQLQRELKERA